MRRTSDHEREGTNRRVRSLFRCASTREFSPIECCVLPGRSAGFTLAELVTVIVIVSVISIYAASRLSGEFARTRASYDQLLVQVQYARKTAMAQRRFVCVHVAAAQSQLYYGTGVACPATTGVASPALQVPYTVNAASGTSFAPASTLQFDGQGRYLTAAGADPGANRTITVSGDGSYAFTVERDTGYVHP